VIVEDNEYLDFTSVPESKGVGKGTYLVVVTGIIGIFVVGFLTVIMSGYGHIWPSEKTMRMDLGSMPTISASQ
jgi:hypothetical protein